MAKKLSKLVGIIAIAMTCTAISASAQDAFYTSFGGGVSLVKDNVSPVYSVRLGMDVDLVFAEVEGSYLSMKRETNTLSTMTMGANVGLKFLSG